MKLMITLNIRKFAKEYNSYAALFNEDTLTMDKVYKMVETAVGNNLNTAINSNFAFMTSEELERFADLFVQDGWKEIVLDKSTRISFFH